MVSLGFWKVAGIKDASVEHNQADVQVTHLTHNLIVELDIWVFGEICNNYPCFHCILGQVPFDNTFQLALSARNETNIKSFFRKLPTELETYAISGSGNKGPGAFTTIAIELIQRAPQELVFHTIPGGPYYAHQLQCANESYYRNEDIVPKIHFDL